MNSEILRRTSFHDTRRGDSPRHHFILVIPRCFPYPAGRTDWTAPRHQPIIRRHGIYTGLVQAEARQSALIDLGQHSGVIKPPIGPPHCTVLQPAGRILRVDTRRSRADN